MYKIILINFDELSLKGKNRSFFKDKLVSHINSLLKLFHQHSFTFLNDGKSILIESDTYFQEETFNALKKVAGMHSFHLVHKISRDLSDIMSKIDLQFKNLNVLNTFQNFKVITKRSDKSFPQNSMEVSSNLGALILDKYPQLKVNVVKPELKVNVRIMQKGVYLSTERIKALGGLPIGSSGHLCTMLSGGIDSPVASHLMFKRGLKQSFMFFWAWPLVGEEVVEKILKIVRVLSTYQGITKLYIIPFGEIQKKISKECRPSYRTLFFRHYMFKLATKVSFKNNLQGIITGDALGQVSSQTLSNMALINDSTDLPILRPLIGYNKIEIIDLAQKIGTYPISIIPYDDACSLLSVKHPAINPYKSYWNHFNDNFDFSDDLQKSIDDMKVLKFNLKGEEQA